MLQSIHLLLFAFVGRILKISLKAGTPDELPGDMGHGLLVRNLGRVAGLVAGKVVNLSKGEEIPSSHSMHAIQLLTLLCGWPTDEPL